MSITSCPYPVNLNPLSPNGFQFSIKKLPELIYFSQEVSLPGISLPTATMNTPFSTVKIAGDKMTYDPLTVNFMVDEKMSNYLAIHDWIVAMGFPHDYEQYISWQNKERSPYFSELAKNYSDGTLSILGSNNVTVQNVTFVDLIPISLSGLSFTTTSDDVSYISCQIEFEYNYFYFS